MIPKDARYIRGMDRIFITLNYYHLGRVDDKYRNISTFYRGIQSPGHRKAASDSRETYLQIDPDDYLSHLTEQAQI